MVFPYRVSSIFFIFFPFPARPFSYKMKTVSSSKQKTSTIKPSLKDFLSLIIYFPIIKSIFTSQFMHIASWTKILHKTRIRRPAKPRLRCRFWSNEIIKIIAHYCSIGYNNLSLYTRKDWSACTVLPSVTMTSASWRSSFQSSVKRFPPKISGPK